MKGLHKGVYILPNLFTSASLFLGFWAIVHAMKITLAGGDNFQWCGVAIIGAGFFDLMDGRVARKTNTASQFGVEYDSLADLVSFGVAPAAVMYLWVLQNFGRGGFLAAFLYLACGALRLARFNVQATSLEKNYFQGLPIPMAAMMLSGTLLIWNGRPVGDAGLFFAGDVAYYLLGLTYVLGGLMVSNVPYRSFKSPSFKGRHPFLYLVIFVVALAIWAFEPWGILFLMGCGYLLSGPIEKYLLPSPIGAIQQVRKKRSVKKSLKRMDALSTQITAEESQEVTRDENVHPLRRS